MKKLENIIALAKSAKDFANSDKDVAVKFPNVALAHINGLSDLILMLVVEVKNNQEIISNLQNKNLNEMQQLTEKDYK